LSVFLADFFPICRYNKHFVISVTPILFIDFNRRDTEQTWHPWSGWSGV